MTRRSTVRYAHRAPRRARRRSVMAAPRRRSVTAAALALTTLGALGGVGTLGSAQATSAGLTDQANLNPVAGAGHGIGSPDRFDIAVVLPDGTVEQADGPEGVDWVVDGADTLVPGHEVTTTVPVFNNTPALSADTRVEVTLRNGDGQVGPDIPNIAELLRFTAVTSQGTVLFSDVGWRDAAASIGVLAPRDGAPLRRGDAYTDGASGSADAVTLTISYPDLPGVEDYNGGQCALALRFHTTSGTP